MSPPGAPARRLVIVGASGIVGRQLLADARRTGAEVIGTALARSSAPGAAPLIRFDLRRDRVRDLVPGLGDGDCVYLLAAYTDQRWVAAHPAEAAALNVDATLRAADEILAAGARVVFLSTEQVFAGATGGYREDDVPSPLSAYARQKREVERHLESASGSWCIARTGAVIAFGDDANCPVAKTYQTLLAPGARMARDNLFTLTDVRDLAPALLALANRERRGIFHLAGAPPVARTELAGWVKESSRRGRDMDYRSIAFAELALDEPRPRAAWLDSTRALRVLGSPFRSPRDSVHEKVRLLDDRGQAMEAAS